MNHVPVHFKYNRFMFKLAAVKLYLWGILACLKLGRFKQLPEPVSGIVFKAESRVVLVGEFEWVSRVVSGSFPFIVFASSVSVDVLRLVGVLSVVVMMFNALAGGGDEKVGCNRHDDE